MLAVMACQVKQYSKGSWEVMEKQCYIRTLCTSAEDRFQASKTLLGYMQMCEFVKSPVIMILALLPN